MEYMRFLLMEYNRLLLGRNRVDLVLKFSLCSSKVIVSKNHYFMLKLTISHSNTLL